MTKNPRFGDGDPSLMLRMTATVLRREQAPALHADYGLIAFEIATSFALLIPRNDIVKINALGENLRGHLITRYNRFHGGLLQSR